MPKTEPDKSRAFITCPFNLIVNNYLGKILSERLSPEIALNGTILDEFKTQSFRRVARIFKKEGIPCTVHAPFTDISIGAVDKKARALAVERLKKALDIAAAFGACSMVFHTGFDERHYLGFKDLWLENANASLDTLCAEAEYRKVPIMLENVFEPSPDIHMALFAAAEAKTLGFCLDIGHVRVFSKTSLAAWLEALWRRIEQLHLHDNLGQKDDHLPIGAGVLDFDALISFLSSKGTSPLITLEPHREEDLAQAIQGLNGLLARFPAFKPRLPSRPLP